MTLLFIQITDKKHEEKSNSEALNELHHQELAETERKAENAEASCRKLEEKTELVKRSIREREQRNEVLVAQRGQQQKSEEDATAAKEVILKLLQDLVDTMSDMEDVGQFKLVAMARKVLSARKEARERVKAVEATGLLAGLVNHCTIFMQARADDCEKSIREAEEARERARKEELMRMEAEAKVRVAKEKRERVVESKMDLINKVEKLRKEVKKLRGDKSFLERKLKEEQEMGEQSAKTMMSMKATWKTTLRKKEEQVSNLKERLKLLQDEMAKLAEEKKRAAVLEKARFRLEEIQKEDERWRKKVCDLERKLAMAQGEVRAAEMVAMEKVAAMRKMQEETAHATTAVALASPSPSGLSSVLTVPSAASPVLVQVQRRPVAAQQVPGVPSAPTSSPAASAQSLPISSTTAGAAQSPRAEDGEENEVDEFALLTPRERRTCEHIYVELEGALAPEGGSTTRGTNRTTSIKPEDATSMYAALYNNVVAIHSGGLEGDLVRLTLNRAFRLHFGSVPEEGASAARAFYQRRRQKQQQ